MHLNSLCKLSFVRAKIRLHNFGNCASFEWNIFYLKILKPIHLNNFLAMTLFFSSKNSAHQQFSIPRSIITYICRNGRPVPAVYYKLYATCKYFYPKFKVVPVKYLSKNNFRERGFSSIITPGKIKSFDFTLYPYEIFHGSDSQSLFAADIISMISFWGITRCYLHGKLILNVAEFQKISSQIKFLSIYNEIQIRGKNDYLLPLEEILTFVPKLQELC